MEARSYLETRTEVSQFVLPEHLNHMGNMHGGEIMKLMDNTAGIAFTRHAKCKAVTAAVNDFKFILPVPQKSIVRCIAEVTKVGRTSMEVNTTLYVENVETGENKKAAQGIFIGVAIDEEGRPVPVAPLKIESEA